MLQDILSYMVYVTIVLIVSYGNRDPNAFYMKVVPPTLHCILIYNLILG